LGDEHPTTKEVNAAIAMQTPARPFGVTATALQAPAQGCRGRPRVAEPPSARRPGSPGPRISYGRRARQRSGTHL